MLIEPTSQAPAAVVMNSRTLVRNTGTPTARADSFEPPTAKIQLPNLVRTSTQAAIPVTITHHTDDDWNCVPPMSKVEANSDPADTYQSVARIRGTQSHTLRRCIDVW